VLWIARRAEAREGTYSTFIFTETARLKNRHPAYHRWCWNRITAINSSSMAIGSLKSRNTKIEWIRYVQLRNRRV
jgi:hypothetical protein